MTMTLEQVRDELRRSHTGPYTQGFHRWADAIDAHLSAQAKVRVACWSLAHKNGGGPLFADYIYDNLEDAQLDADALNGDHGDLEPIALYTHTAERAAVPDEDWLEKVVYEASAAYGSSGPDWLNKNQYIARKLHEAMLTAAPQPPEGARVVPDDVEAVIACLGDDAAFLRMENDGESEISDNMERAIEIIELLAGKEGA